MKLPTWTPPDLIERHQELAPKAKEEKKRSEEFKRRNLRDDRKITEYKSGEFVVGYHFLGHCGQLEILEKLASAPAMRHVWDRLSKRSESFKPLASLNGGKTYAVNLVGTCIDAETEWRSLPKLTRAESRKFYEEIATVSLGLAAQLLNASSPELLEVRRFIDKEHFETFIKGLEHDDHDIWYGFEGYLEMLLGEMLGTVPGLLMELHRRALEHSKYPQAVSQPNAASAKVNFYVRWLSDYFKRTYGQPLHAHVAVVTNALLGSDIDEDRVRALSRSKKGIIRTLLPRQKVVPFGKEE